MKSLKLTTQLTLAAVGLSAGLISACSPDNPRLMAPTPPVEEALKTASPRVVVTTPKVDILFMIDNSGSMDDDVEKLSKNIDKFTDAMAKNSGIDFHVGAVSVWDSITFENMKKEFAIGQLRPLKAPDGSKLEGFAPFVSSKENYDEVLAKRGVSLKKEAGWLQVLRASLKIGIEPYDSNFKKSGKGGPNIEEVFTPIKAALSEPMLSGPNKDFRRSDAHLVLVIITDSDASVRTSAGKTFDLSPGEMQTFLQEHVGSDYLDRVTTLGVLAQAGDKQKDPALTQGSKTEPVEIQTFIRNMGGTMMGLTENDYGVKLASFGEKVRQRTITRPLVFLESIPQWDTLSVKLNGVQLQGGEWEIDRRRNSIVINAPLSMSGNNDIRVDYTQVSMDSVNGGRTHGVLSGK